MLADCIDPVNTVEKQKLQTIEYASGIYSYY